MTRILLAEDNEMNREVLSRRLLRRGYEVVEAVDGAEAIEAALADPPALILMDLSMPNVDGWEATARLRESPEMANTPIVALTAHAIRSDRDRAIECGCNAVLTKPFTTAELFEMLDRFLPNDTDTGE